MNDASHKFDSDTSTSSSDTADDGAVITALQSTSGTLTKRYTLGADDELIAHKKVFLVSGYACTVVAPNATRLAEIITKLSPKQAITCGKLIDEPIGHTVQVASKDLLAQTIAAYPEQDFSHIRTRTRDRFEFPAGRPGWMLLDIDLKGMPEAMRAKLEEAGLLAVLCSLLPGLGEAAYVLRASTSSGIHKDGETLQGITGWHIYVLLDDASAIPRAVKALAKRCWLAGWGWGAVSERGAFLTYALVDVHVATPEHICFEVGPTLGSGLGQFDRPCRVNEGGPLRSSEAIPEPTAAEEAQYEALREAERRRLGPALTARRQARIQAEKAAAIERGVMPEAAERMARRLVEGGVLLADFAPEWDDAKLAGKTIRDVLLDPAAYVGETMACPGAGLAYGPCKAMVLGGWDDDPPVIHSFAHGPHLYRLGWGIDAAHEILAKAADDTLVATLARMIHRTAGLTDIEIAQLRDAVIARLGKLKIREKDVRDQLKAALAVEKLCDEYRREQQRQQEREASGKSTIVALPSKLDELARAAEDAIIAMGLPIYQRGGNIVRPGFFKLPAADEGTTTTAVLHPLRKGGLRGVFCEAAYWETLDRKGKNVPVDPPEAVALVLLDMVGNWRLPTVRGVLTTPTMRPDGSILTAAGYDAVTNYYLLDLPTMPELPPKPSKDQAVEALALMKGLLTGFPFKEVGSRSVALSAMLTAVVRGAMPVAPLHAMSAPTAGSGKSFCFDVVAGFVLGDRCPIIAVGSSPEEFEKRLNGMLLRAPVMFSIDNVEQPLKGDLLCQACERPKVDLRRLGGSDIYPSLNGGLICSTGNNLVVLGDLTRRVLRGFMDSGEERPYLRAFSFNPFVQVLRERGRYIAAALTVVRAYLEAGEPALLSALGSYEAWSRFVRGPLVWLGEDDPVATMESLREEDLDLNALRDLLSGWEMAYGRDVDVAPGAAIQKCRELAGGEVDDAVFAGLPGADGQPVQPDPADEALEAERKKFAQLGRAIAGIATRYGSLNAFALAKWLRKQRGKPVDGRKFVDRKDTTTNSQVWRVTAS
jgi:putative DNA primase/helicase